MKRIEKAFLQTIADFNMITPEDRILVAVSGGPDSMVLLDLLKNHCPGRIGVFHLNHQFRPEAADEAAFVARMAQLWDLPHWVHSYDVREYLKRTGDSKQQGARRVRYYFLEQTRKKEGYTKIALGHHLDDQAETVLMRLIRGSGPTGLRGMLPVRGCYIRPLIRISKEDVLSYCKRHSIDFVSDLSNLTDDYFRNKLRNNLIPLIEKEYNPEFRTHLARLAQVIREEDREMDKLVESISDRLIKVEKDQVVIERAGFRELSVAIQRRLLREAIVLYKQELRRIDFQHIEQLRTRILKPTPFQWTLPQIWVEGTANYIILAGEKQSPILIEPKQLPVPGVLAQGDLQIRTKVFSREELPPRQDNSEDFDLEELSLPLAVRAISPGDRIVPFGHSSPKKISRLLIEAKIPRSARRNLAVLCDQTEIMWLIGIRRGEKGRISDKTQHVLRITIN